MVVAKRWWVCVYSGLQPVWCVPSAGWAASLQRDTFLAFPARLLSVFVHAREMPVFPCPLGTLLWLLGDQSLGWCKGGGGHCVLHQLLGNQTAMRLKIIKIKAFHANLLLEPEWVLGWLGELQRPFPAFSTGMLSQESHAVTPRHSHHLSRHGAAQSDALLTLPWVHCGLLFLPVLPASVPEAKGVLGASAHSG